MNTDTKLIQLVTINGTNYLPIEKLVLPSTDTNDFNKRSRLCEETLGVFIQRTNIKRPVPLLADGLATITYMVPESNIAAFNQIWNAPKAEKTYTNGHISVFAVMVFLIGAGITMISGTAGGVDALNKPILAVIGFYLGFIVMGLGSYGIASSMFRKLDSLEAQAKSGA